MKRFFVLSFIAAATALGIWYGLRGTGLGHTSSATVTALLPKGTLALLYLPDFKRSRAQWHETDLYKLWSEPAVQDFLRKPLTRSPESEKARRKMHEMDALEMRDAFLAVTAFANDRPSVIGGFRFKSSVADAEKVIGPWRARLREKMPEAKSETVTYEGHQLEIVSRDTMTAATAYDGDWFFLSNDVPSLKEVLDRLDRKIADKASTLTADENFIAVAGQMPPGYAAFGYARLDEYMKKLAAKLPAGAADSKQVSALRQIRSLAAATTFKDGKMHDVFFVAMPKIEAGGALTRSSLTLATKESFFYFASILNLPPQVELPDASSATASGLPAALRSFLAAGAANGITRADWSDAFGNELGVIGDWPANNRLPSLFATLAVKDAAKARHIVESLTIAAPATDGWTQSEKDGVQYFSQPPPNPMLPVAPTLGLSSKLLVAGLDAASVGSAVHRGEASNSELADAKNFKTAGSTVAVPTHSFTYLDTALLYQRLDAALRPMLVMAALMPSVAENVDLGKLPAAEVITGHLSPLVISQSYSGDGYRVEAVGPVSVFQAAVGGIVASGVGTGFYKKQMQPGRAQAEQSPSPERPAGGTGTVPSNAPSPSGGETPDATAGVPPPSVALDL